MQTEKLLELVAWRPGCRVERRPEGLDRRLALLVGLEGLEVLVLFLRDDEADGTAAPFLAGSVEHGLVRSRRANRNEREEEDDEREQDCPRALHHRSRAGRVHRFR